jgi:hypothetical protein
MGTNGFSAALAMNVLFPPDFDDSNALPSMSSFESIVLALFHAYS